MEIEGRATHQDGIGTGPEQRGLQVLTAIPRDGLHPVYAMGQALQQSRGSPATELSHRDADGIRVGDRDQGVLVHREVHQRSESAHFVQGRHSQTVSPKREGAGALSMGGWPGAPGGGPTGREPPAALEVTWLMFMRGPPGVGDVTQRPRRRRRGPKPTRSQVPATRHRFPPTGQQAAARLAPDSSEVQDRSPTSSASSSGKAAPPRSSRQKWPYPGNSR